MAVVDALVGKLDKPTEPDRCAAVVKEYSMRGEANKLSLVGITHGQERDDVLPVEVLLGKNVGDVSHYEITLPLLFGRRLN
jgi:hypothetical protein